MRLERSGYVITTRAVAGRPESSSGGSDLEPAPRRYTLRLSWSGRGEIGNAPALHAGG